MMRLFKFLVSGAGLLAIASGLIILTALVLPNLWIASDAGLASFLLASGLSPSSSLYILSFIQVTIGGLLLCLGLWKPVLAKRVLSIALLSAAALLYLSGSLFWPLTTIFLITGAALAFFYNPTASFPGREENAK